MINSRPIIIQVVCLIVCAFFLVPSVSAATLVIPQTYHYAGLTFDSPLTIPTSPLLKKQTLMLTFGNLKPLMKVSVTKNKSILAEAITPTPIKSEPKPTPSVTRLATKLSSNKEIIPTVTIVDSTPTPVPPTPTSTVAPASYVSGGLSADKLFDLSNQYRASKGLPPFQKDERACQLASSRAPEVGAEIAEGHMHSGLRERNLSYWNSENIISYNSEEEAFNWWINDTIHREQIEGNYTYSCVACAGNACAQEFTNFQPK